MITKKRVVDGIALISKVYNNIYNDRKFGQGWLEPLDDIRQLLTELLELNPVVVDAQKEQEDGTEVKKNA